MGSHISSGLCWAHPWAVGRGEALLTVAGLLHMSGRQLAKGWSAGTTGLSSSCLLHAQASAPLQLASPGTFSGWPGHVLTAVSDKGGRKCKHAGIFFPKLPVSSHLAHWPKQVTYQAQCQSGRRLQSYRAKGMDTRKPVLGVLMPLINTPAHATPSINHSLVCATSVFTLSSVVLLFPLYYNIVANLSVFSKRLGGPCASAHSFLSIYWPPAMCLIPLQTSQRQALVLTHNSH